MESNVFTAFLVKAKKNTYAAGKNKVEPLRPDTIDLAFEEGGYSYRDSYYGNTCFSGQEVVYKNGKPFWSMNYYGKILKADIPAGTVETLKEALMLVDESSPFRGPGHHMRGDFEYKCRCRGTVEFFHGVENILHKGKEVYKLFFHGGMLE